MRLRLISAKIDQSITIANDGLVGVLEQCLQLCLILQDDVGGNVPASHCGNDLRKAVREGE